MIKLALSFLLGVLLFQTSSELPTLTYLVCFPILVLIWLRFPQTLPLVVIFFAYSWTHVFAYHQLTPQLASDLEGEDIDIQGVIEKVNRQNSRYSKFILHVSQDSLIRWNQRLPEKLELSWYQPAQEVHEQQLCNLTVKLKRIRGFSSPGVNDYEKSLFLRGIGARGYLKRGVCVFQQQPYERLLDKREVWVEEFIQASQTHQYGHLMQALTFGYRENIDAAQWEVLRKTGTAHLLAISGLHISAVAFIVFFCVRRLCCLSAALCNMLPAHYIAACVALIAVLFYAYLAGFSLPTQRALIMVSVGLSAALLRRPIFNLSVYSYALLLVLLVNPLAVLSAGFWMSFLAVLFIVIAIKVSQSLSKISRIIFIQVFLSVALFPITLLFFSEASIVAPIVNLIAIPLISFIALPLLLIAQCGFLLDIAGTKVLFEILDLFFLWFWHGLEFFANFRFSAWQFTPTLLGVVCFEIGLFILVQAKGLMFKHLAWVFIAALFISKQTALKPKQMRVSALDVGQGLAVIIETPNYTMLYDAGMKSMSGFNTGEMVVKPYLDRRGIKHINTAMISHNDNDHAGGMHWLLQHVNIKQLVVSNQPDLYSGNNITLCRAGDEWYWDGISFKVLHPPMEWHSNDNNRSCVVQITHSAGKILLTGDIEQRAEQWLIDQYGANLASDLITAPHHGSKSSSSYRFVDLVHPQTVVFSAGYRNRYGFPHATIRQRYQRSGAHNVDTISQGTVTFLFDPETGIQKQAGYRLRHKRYWHSTEEELTDSIE